ncbi:hypothetical protein H6504_04290 [Candidatus Woesearchaeota archaeon]|nr:hypothetical protein [Candidatus Woesearchaeota archaeon]
MESLEVHLTTVDEGHGLDRYLKDFISNRTVGLYASYLTNIHLLAQGYDKLYDGADQEKALHELAVAYFELAFTFDDAYNNSVSYCLTASVSLDARVGAVPRRQFKFISFDRGVKTVIERSIIRDADSVMAANYYLSQVKKAYRIAGDRLLDEFVRRGIEW